MAEKFGHSLDNSSGHFNLSPIPYDKSNQFFGPSETKLTRSNAAHGAPITTQPTIPGIGGRGAIRRGSLDTASANHRMAEAPPPPGTLQHVVSSGQTLESVALLFDCSPSYLLKLNKRISRVVFPGEVILVPDRDNPAPVTSPTDKSKLPPAPICLDPVPSIIPTQAFRDISKHSMDFAFSSRERLGSASPNHLDSNKENRHSKRSLRRPKPLTREESNKINEECAENFLKIRVKHYITGTERVEGTLLVTPNAVMFESTEDPPSADHQLIIPMNVISSASMFSDISKLSHNISPNSSPSSPANRRRHSPNHDHREDGSSPSRHKAQAKDSDQSGSSLASRRNASQDSLASQSELPLFLRISIQHYALHHQHQQQAARSPSSSSTGGDSKDLSKLRVTGNVQPHYWFRISPNWVDRVYAFFVQWTPGDDKPEGGANAFVILDELDVSGAADDPEAECDTLVTPFGEQPADQTTFAKEWEVLHIEEYTRRKQESFEKTLSLPDWVGSSQIIGVPHVRKLMSCLPPRFVGATWCCMYNSREHGISINTLYRRLATLEKDTGCLLLIQQSLPDELSTNPLHVFGAVLSHPLQPKDGYYGTGQTSVFRFVHEDLDDEEITRPRSSGIEVEASQDLKIESFGWTGTNSLFIWATPKGIMVGGDDHGKPALTIDAELLRGESHACRTFGNPVLTADGKEDFKLIAMEVWAFVQESDLETLGITENDRVPLEL